MSAVRKRESVRAEEITSPEFERLARSKMLAILSFGSMEEHGPHLPLGTDSMQAAEVARRVADELGAVLLPPIGYGECRSTRDFPGTISLSFETVRSLAQDILSELVRNNVHDVVIVSGHAGSGHMAALKLGAQRAIEDNPELRVMVLSDYDLAYDLRGKEFPEGDGHAGRIETSRILNLRPDLVGEARPVGKTWSPRFMMVSYPRQYFPTGVMGDSRGSTADCGKRIDDYVVERLCALITDNFGLSGGRAKSRKRRGA